MSRRTDNQTTRTPSDRPRGRTNDDAGTLPVRAVRRRGSALVLVVGTLALIAVFAAFYVTLGQSDTRLSRGVEEGGAIEEVERQFAEHIAGIVGADRTAVFPETITEDETIIGPRFAADNTAALDPLDEQDRQRFVREATDYPYTDYTRMSIVSQLTVAPAVWVQYRNKPANLVGNQREVVERFRFRPAGDDSFMLDLRNPFDQLNLQGDPAALADRRVASDPWLAPNEPTFTGRFDRNFPVSFHDSRIFSGAAAPLSAGATPEELFYLDNHDWAQISNPAPDGLSVNLWNLRNNFDAESGLGVDDTERPRMSENRTLLSVAQDGTFRLRASGRLHIDPDGTFVPSIVGLSPQDPNADPRTLAVKNTPAWWTMNQRFLYFPADPSFQILGRDVDGSGRPINTQLQAPASLVLQTPDRPDHPDLQYADADGDGFYDSRWYELRDSTLGAGGVQDLLANDTGMRFFFAPRIIDLSAKVNVNSATDGLAPFTSEVPAGATPAEVDLRRILTGEDSSERFAPVFPNPNAVGAVTGPQRLSYAHIQRLPYEEAQVQNAGRLVAADYERAVTGYDVSFNGGLGVNGVFPLDGPALLSGRYAYDAIRRAIQGDPAILPDGVTNRRGISALGLDTPLVETSPFEYYLFDPMLTGDASSYNVAQRNIRSSQSLGFGSELAYTPATLDQIRAMPAARRDYWHFVGGTNIADPADPPLTASGFGGALFDLNDLSELLVHHGLNDDRVLSRLERVTQGRFDSNDAAFAPDGTTKFGPLRANRPTDLERRFHDDRDNLVNPADGSAGRLSDNRVDHESMALLALNPRLRLTTISGAAPLRSRVVEDLDGDGVLSADERRLTAADARLDLTANPSARDLFALYSDALLPYSFVDATWANDPEGDLPLLGGATYTLFNYNQNRTLSYGHRGSELALRLSAHLAVNMKDQLDDDDTPSAATVLAATTFSTGVPGRDTLDNALTQGQGQESAYAWWADGNQFDLGDDRLAPQGVELDDPALLNDFSRQAYSVFGLEAQPFLTEVAVITVYTDVPRAALGNLNGEYDTDPLVGNEIAAETEAVPPNFGLPLAPFPNSFEDRAEIFLGPVTPGLQNCPGGVFGYDQGEVDDVDLRRDTSGDNPDLMLHVLAIQLTNPFDVPINLTDDEDPIVANPNGIGFIPNESLINNANAPGAVLPDSKFYIEFNGHFFPLAEYIENTQHRGFVNPFVANGGPGLYRIVLQPGESRVVYVSAHPSLNDLSLRWKEIEEVYRGRVGDQLAPDVSPDWLADGNTTAYAQHYIEDQLAVRGDSNDTGNLIEDDVVYPSRLIPFNPRTGQTLQVGPGSSRFVEFMRTNLTERFPDPLDPNPDDSVARMRQEVRLWRKLAVETQTLGGNEGETFVGGTDNGPNFLGNDLLADRLRDPAIDTTSVQNVAEATLDFGTLDWDRIRNRDYLADPLQAFDPFTATPAFWQNATNAQNNQLIPLSMSTDDTVGDWNFWGGTNQGLTVCMRAGYRRPDHLIDSENDGLVNQDGFTPRGLLPAWCIEGIEKNHNIAQPAFDGALDGIQGPQEVADTIDSAINDRFFGEFFGFRGCHGRTDFAEPNAGARGGMFYMNFLRFLKDTKVRRNQNGAPEPGAVRVEAEGFNDAVPNGVAGLGTTVGDPMLVPTITRHPAIKFRRIELINELPDTDGDGLPDNLNDQLFFENMIANRVFPAKEDVRVAQKRSMAIFGSNPTVPDAEVFAERPAVIGAGDDGFAAQTDPRNDLVRLGDLLLPFAVGSIFAPDNPNADATDFRPGDWITFSEAMSAALGFEPAGFYNLDPGQPGWNLLSELVDARGRRNTRQLPDTLAPGTQFYERTYVLERGRLDLNAFTPFVNRIEMLAGGSVLSTEPEFDPEADPLLGNLLASDTRVGFSEPPAQRLLSLATALNRGGDPLTTPLIGTVNLNTAPDAVLRAVPGFATPLQFSGAGVQYDQYNPFGAPPAPGGAERLMDWGPGRVAFKRTDNGGSALFYEPVPMNGEPWRPPFGVPDPFGNWDGSAYDGSWENVADIASSLTAWRDRTRAAFRRPSRANFAPGVPGTPQLPNPPQPDRLYDFTPNLLIGTGFLNSPPQWPRVGNSGDILSLALNNFATDYSRNAISGQNASSEQPGLAGVGSLLGLTVARFDPLADNPNQTGNPQVVSMLESSSSPNLNWGRRVFGEFRQGQATRLAFDGFAMEAIDQDENGEADTDPTVPGNNVFLNIDDLINDDNFSYTLGRGRYLNENPDLEDRQRGLEDEVVDDILEELAVLNGAANAVDVRSDFFAAWFLVRGYREDDVEGLEPGEPMRPTYEKRFLMVLDRSNVTEAGQLPRVLFIREVPL